MRTFVVEAPGVPRAPYPPRGRMPNPRRGEWDLREDAVLRDLTRQVGDTDWCVISSLMKDAGIWRSPRQCRERYKNHVRPGIRLGACRQLFCRSTPVPSLRALLRVSVQATRYGPPGCLTKPRCPCRTLYAAGRPRHP